MQSATATRKISRNVRFLLWQAGRLRDDWAGWLESRGVLDRERRRRLLSGDLEDSEVSLDEVTSLAEHLNQDVESLRFADLAVEGRDVLLENLRFLLHTLDHGGKKELASFVGIDPTTVSRWRRGTHPPQGPSLQVIVRYFGLPPETDLREEPVFLVASPIVTTEGKRWLHDRIEALSPDELRGLFPALRRLLSDK